MSQTPINSLSINIKLLTTPVPQKGFGIYFIVGSGVAEIAPVLVADEADLISSGYLSTDEEYKMAAAFFAQDPRPEKAYVYRKLDATLYDAALDSVLASNIDDWYLIGGTSRTKTDANAIATWANSNQRMFIGATADFTTPTARTGLYEHYYNHSTPGDYPDARVAGFISSRTPGSYTVAYANPLIGATDSDLIPAEVTTTKTDNANYIGYFHGQFVPFEGKVSEGNFVSTIIHRDYTKAKIEEALGFLLLNNDIIPTDLPGIGRIVNVIRSALKGVANTGGIAEVGSDEDYARSDDGKWQFKVSGPDSLSDIPPADRAAGKVPITASYRQAIGAIYIDVDITVTV